MSTFTSPRLSPPLQMHTTSTCRKSVFASSPPAEALPPPVFDNTSSACPEAVAGLIDGRCCSPEAVLPATVTQQPKYFHATVVSVVSDDELPTDRISGQCPRWSVWATSQFAFDYLFILVTSSMAPEL